MAKMGYEYRERPWTEFVRENMGHVDPTISAVNIWRPSIWRERLDPHMFGEIAESELRLVAAIAAAAMAASKLVPKKGGGHPTPMESSNFEALKKSVDQIATSAGESILSQTKSRIEIRAGEGARDDSPGASLGQVFGEGTPIRHGVIDYIDGTGLAAAGLPNSLALGALGRYVAKTPDSKVFAILGPRTALANITLDESPLIAAQRAVQSISASQPPHGGRLRLLTHSADTGEASKWYRYLRSLAVDLQVPDPIAVEPPFILSLALDAHPLINGMIGVMGLVELVYAAMLLDLLSSPYAFKFRLVGRTNSKDLLSDPPLAYALRKEDLAIAHLGGLAPTITYSSDDFVPAGSASIAALFAVTDGPALKLPPATSQAVAGYIVRRNEITGVTVHYADTRP